MMTAPQKEEKRGGADHGGERLREIPPMETGSEHTDILGDNPVDGSPTSFLDVVDPAVARMTVRMAPRKTVAPVRSGGMVMVMAVGTLFGHFRKRRAFTMKTRETGAGKQRSLGGTDVVYRRAEG